MDPEAWKRLEDVFFEAVDLETEARVAFLDRACGEDADFRREVEAVLAAHEASRTRDGAVSTDRVGAGHDVGRRVGAYRLEERIGMGGMGEVYRAHRADEQYKQEVAVKLVRSNLPAKEMVRRFRVERQVLARLQHPNVATLLDGGVSDDGRPYLVMQYVPGVPITEYADTRRIGIRDRLELFGTVCRAVQYAHANLVVHRDLKPSNILVTDDGQVRLLDFGIAKLLDPEGVGITAPLTEGLLLLTPEHAAPEQIRGDSITTATDVYALGVLLYELLTGTRPFRSTPALDLHRLVCEQEPLRPSAAVIPVAGGTDERNPAEVAAARGTRLSSLRDALRGDLDHMVLMALRKEPERRYASADQFAEDVERYLRGRPILARKDSLRYRTSKFYRRNRLGVAAAVAFVLVLAGATAFSTLQSVQRARALGVAEVERDKAARLSDFLVSVFSASNPNESRGESVTARELLDRAAERIDDGLEDDPLVQADLAIAIGKSYGGLGLVEPAGTLFERALEQRKRALPSNDLAIAQALDHLGQIRQREGEYAVGFDLVRRSLRMRELALGPSDTVVARTLTVLGRIQIDLGQYDSAATLLSRAEAIQRAQDPVDGRALANTLRYRWVASDFLGRPPEEGFAIASEALAVARTALGEEDPFVFNVYEDYALALQTMDLADSAAAVHRSILEKRERVFGPDHPDVAYSLFNLGRVMGNAQGLWAESHPYLERAIEIRERSYGPDHPTVASALHSYAIAVAFAGDIDRSAEIAARAVTIREAQLDERAVTLLDSMEFLAQLRGLQGRVEETLDLLETLVDRGWWNPTVLEGNPISSVRDHPRFQRLLERGPPEAAPSG